MSKTLVLLNKRAGTMIDEGPERLRDEITQALSSHGDQVDIEMVEPKKIAAAIEQAANGPHDTLIVGGGDGSINCAANALAGSSKTLGILPFGTMNLLGRDLGMPRDPHQAIAALATATPRAIDLVSMGGKLFHSLSGIGFFSQMARAREEVRGNPIGRFVGVGVAAFRAVARTQPFTLDIVVDGKREEIDAIAVLITNNRFREDWRRTQLDEGLIEIHIAQNRGVLSKLRAGSDMITGTWRDAADDDVRNIVGREVTITRRRHHTWAATDGELRRERIPMHYAVKPKALTVLAAAA